MTEDVWVDASDVGTILHDNPYATRKSLLLHRCRDRLLGTRTTPTHADASSVPEALTHGRVQERAALRAYEAKRGTVHVPQDTYTNPRFPGLRGRPDGIRPSDRVVVEIKCPMSFHPPDVACIPKVHVHQMQAYLHLLGYDRCDYVQYDAWNDRMDIIDVEKDGSWWDRVAPALRLFREQLQYYSANDERYRLVAPPRSKSTPLPDDVDSDTDPVPNEPT